MAKHFKKYFFSGLAVFLPFILTLYVSIWALNFAESLFGRYLRPFFLDHYDFYFWGLGIVILLGVILLSGFLITNYFGRSAHRLAEGLMMRIPLVANIYPAFKEIATFLFREDATGRHPEQVVLVEWPSPGIYTIGFVTNKTPKIICQQAGADLVNVLVPTVPNPLSGFIMMFPREKVKPLAMSVEEAVKIIVSGGVVDPHAIPVHEENPAHN